MIENPFEYDAATALKPEYIVKVFIEDHNYTRFIRSTKNVFLLGERGAGKSMTLLYNSYPLRASYDSDNIQTVRKNIGIYIPCNTPLNDKREYELLENLSLASVLAEHYLVASIAYQLADTLAKDQEIVSLLRGEKGESLAQEISYIFMQDLPAETVSKQGVLDALRLFFDRETRRIQTQLNKASLDEYIESGFTFNEVIRPLLNLLRSRIELIQESHFSFLIDDAHDLNHLQKKLINSWIAFRDRSVFSFKVAIADIGHFDYSTNFGGSIIEGHDYISIDMEKAFQSSDSAFGKLARDIINKRLDIFGIKGVTADEFFPENKTYSNDIEKCKDIVRAEYLEENSTATPKQITDHVYKYARVRYFRDRSAKANRITYSGLNTIIHVSTGVIRNLLDPCYWMFDKASDNQNGKPINFISSQIQDDVLKSRSDFIWAWVKGSMKSAVKDCDDALAEKIYNLFEQLGVLFKERLKHHNSEPRAIAFSISGETEDLRNQIEPVLEVAKQARLLYSRFGSAKDDGKREKFYVPNRLLWVSRGLDVEGQHARVSLKAKDILAAMNGTRFPYDPESKKDLSETSQGELL